MDWVGAIERNSEALKGVIAALFVLLGDATVERFSDSVYRAVLRVLRPTESAVRRLIVIAARGLVVTPSPPRPKPTGTIGRGRQSRASFQLFDPRKNFAERGHGGPRVIPRIHVFGHDPRVAAIWAAPARSAPTPVLDDGLINGKRLVGRLHAVKAALDNLPLQARRLVRARQRRAHVPSLRLKSPLRPGPPPGHRKKRHHEIDEILAECHGLAHDALRLDTS